MRILTSLIAILILGLSGCVNSPTPAAEIEPEILDAATVAARFSPTERVRYYDTLAQRVEPNKRSYYQLLAAEELMAQNQTDAIRNRIAQINLRSLDQSYHYRVELLDAQMDLQENKAPLALQKLPKPLETYPIEFRIRIIQTRAEALSRLGYQQDSLESYLELDEILQSQTTGYDKAIQENHQTIWRLLQKIPDEILQDYSGDTSLTGWVALTLAVRQAQQAGIATNVAIQDWLQKYPNHPANKTFQDLLTTQNNLVKEYPKKLALLLPLSGRYGAAAAAVRDGFMAAYYNSLQTVAVPEIQIYDTGENQLIPAYESALRDGAGMIVGPLERTAVETLLQQANIPIPVLTLNYAEINITTTNPNIIQFGLLPEDEASQAAELAIIKNQQKVIIFAPKNTLGQRLSEAFAARYRNLGGEILGTETYTTESYDHGDTIQRAMNILQSKNRHTLLSSTLGQAIEFEPQRRQDVQAILLIATPEHARNFRAQLKFYGAGDIVIYSTSQVYSGIIDASKDKDMDGIIFTETPWILQNTNNQQFAKIAEYWPQNLQNYSRLYALGLDAYRIIPHLMELRQSPYAHFSGLTGNITLDSQQRIHRELLWAVFEQGIPTIMDFSSLEKHSLFDPEDDISYLKDQ